MKKFIYSILLSVFVLFPINVLAAGNISVSPNSLVIELGGSKTFTITAYNTIGDVSIKSSNSSIASVNTSSWSTGMVEEKQTKTGTITVTGNSVGNTTIVLNVDAATFDEEDLSGQTRVININVIAKPTTTTTTTKKITTTKTVAQTEKSTTTVKSNKGISTTKKQVSNNANLKSITINDLNVDFNENKDVYDITVSNDTDVLDIKAETSHSGASFKIEGDTNLKEGLNVIKIVTLAEDKLCTKTYTLNITRKEKEAELSSNTYIKSISIKNHKINFDKDIRNYELTIKDENNLDITIILEDMLSNYKIIGNNNLKDKSIIKIIVTAEDGKTDTYYINIDKKSNNNILIFIGIFLVIIGLGLLIFFIKKNKDEKGNDKLSENNALNSVANESKIDEITDAETGNIENVKSNLDSEIIFYDKDDFKNDFN